MGPARWGGRDCVCRRLRYTATTRPAPCVPLSDAQVRVIHRSPVERSASRGATCHAAATRWSCPMRMSRSDPSCGVVCWFAQASIPRTANTSKWRKCRLIVERRLKYAGAVDETSIDSSPSGERPVSAPNAVVTTRSQETSVEGVVCGADSRPCRECQPDDSEARSSPV